MPQDKRRSISYRSFITCDDPNGIECGIITKSKINSPKREQDNTKIEANKKLGNDNQNTFVNLNVVKEDIETNKLVALKLLNVSKEADKLNHLIKSWYNDNKSKGNQKNNITKDLLKGGIDLQESLFMLEKLQDVLGESNKEKQKLEGATFGGMVSVIRGFERSPIDLNGSYRRKIVDEMRNVIQESILRKKMIKNPVFEELYDYDYEKMASHDMLPSDSSSKFSQRRKGEESNLIGKLMGLESLPSSSSTKRLEFGAKDVGMKKKNVEEIPENSKFKGVIRNCLVNPCLGLIVPCMPKFCRENMKKNIRGSSKVKTYFGRQQQKLQMEQVEVKKASEGEEKKDGKSNDHLSSRDHETCTTLKNQRKNDGISYSRKEMLSKQKMASSTMLDHKTQRISELKKNRQPALVVEEKRVSRQEKKESELINEDSEMRGEGNSGNLIVDSVSIDDNEKERCQIPIRDYDIDTQRKLLDTSEETSYFPKYRKIPHYDGSQSSTSQITSMSTIEYCDTNQGDQSLKKDLNSDMKTPTTKLKALILSNKLCVNHIEKLFNIQVNHDFVSYVIDNGDDQDLENPNLLIDCAKEVLELKSSRFSQASFLLPRTLDCVLEEVCNGIEDLRCYSKSIYEKFPSGYLHVLLDRDLRLKSGIWGVGWRRMYTPEEIEQVICEIDTFVLSKLIEETLLDFLK